MLLRASNAVGYTNYPDNVVRHFVTQAAAGERPFNTVHPTAIDVAEAEANPPDLGWVDALADAPVHLVIGVDLQEVAAFDAELDRVGVVGGTLTTFVSRAESAVQELVGFPDHVAVAALVPLGHPTKLLTRLSRRPVEEFARWERWDGEPVRPS